MKACKRQPVRQSGPIQRVGSETVPRQLVRCAEVINSTGLHARAAAGLAKVVRALDAHVTLEHRGMAADARSVLSIMLLGAATGDIVRIRATGPNAAEAAEAVANLFACGFGCNA